MSLSALRAGLQELAQLDDALQDADISARLTAIDIALQGLEITQQRKAQDPSLALVVTIQQRRILQDLRRLAFEILGYKALIKVNIGENEPFPAMLEGVPPQLVRLAQDYIQQLSDVSLVTINNPEEPTYARLANLLLAQNSMCKEPHEDTP